MTTIGSIGSNGYKSVWSAPKFDKESGAWTQHVIAMVPDDSGSKPSLFGGSTESSNNTNSSSNKNNSSLFGSNNTDLFGSGLDNYINKAKDISNFQLGQNENLATFYSGLRNTEADNSFGRQYKLNQQQYDSDKAINQLQQDATTNRLQSQLNSQQLMQQNDFNQQNLFRSQSAALALRGLQ